MKYFATLLGFFFILSLSTSSVADDNAPLEYQLYTKEDANNLYSIYYWDIGGEIQLELTQFEYKFQYDGGDKPPSYWWDFFDLFSEYLWDISYFFNTDKGSLKFDPRLSLVATGKSERLRSIHSDILLNKFDIQGSRVGYETFDHAPSFGKEYYRFIIKSIKDQTPIELRFDSRSSYDFEPKIQGYYRLSTKGLDEILTTTKIKAQATLDKHNAKVERQWRQASEKAFQNTLLLSSGISAAILIVLFGGYKAIKGLKPRLVNLTKRLSALCNSSRKSDSTQEMLRWTALKDKGVITEEQFEKKRTAFLEKNLKG